MRFVKRHHPAEGTRVLPQSTRDPLGQNAHSGSLRDPSAGGGASVDEDELAANSPRPASAEGQQRVLLKPAMASLLRIAGALAPPAHA